MILKARPAPNSARGGLSKSSCVHQESVIVLMIVLMIVLLIVSLDLLQTIVADVDDLALGGSLLTFLHLAAQIALKPLGTGGNGEQHNGNDCDR